jgi:hypothetical protein
MLVVATDSLLATHGWWRRCQCRLANATLEVGVMSVVGKGREKEREREREREREGERE